MIKARLSTTAIAVVVVSLTTLLLVILGVYFFGSEPSTEAPVLADKDPAAEALSPGAPSYLIAVLLISMIVAGAALAVAVRLLYWSKQLQGGQTSILPNALLQEWASVKHVLGQLMEEGETFQADNRKRIDTVSHNVNTLQEAFAIFSDSLNKKDSEIERLRNGGDLVVYRRFLNRFIKLHAAFQAEIANGEEKGRDVSELEDLLELLEDALYESGAQKFSPRVGVPYTEEFGVADSPRIVRTDDPAQIGLIVSVIKPGFRIIDGGQLLEPARVVVYQANS